MADTVLTFETGHEAWQPEIAAPASWQQPEAPAPSPQTLELAQSSHEAIDAELLGIFLEEAHEVLASIAEQSAVLAGDRSNVEALMHDSSFGPYAQGQWPHGRSQRHGRNCLGPGANPEHVVAPGHGGVLRPAGADCRSPRPVLAMG